MRVPLAAFACLFAASSVVNLSARQPPGGVGLSRPGIGPGQGPQIPYQDLEWRYWWWLNQEWLLDLRGRLGISGSRVADADRDPAIDALLAAARASDPDLQAAALLALGKSGDDRAEAAMRAALHDGNVGVRRAALLALGLRGRPAAIDTLSAVIADDGVEGRLRATAAVALGMIESRDGPPLTAVAFNADLTRVAASSGDAILRVFDTATGAEIDRHAAPAPIGTVAWLGETLAVGCADGSLWLDQARRGDEGTRIAAHRGAIGRLAVAQDGRLCVSASTDHTLCVYEVRSMRKLGTLTTADQLVTAIACAPGGDAVYFTTTEPALHRVAPPWSSSAMLTRLDAPVALLAATADGTQLVAIGADGVARVLTTADGATVTHLDPLPAAPAALAIDRHATRIALAAQDGSVRIDDLATGATITRVQHPGGAALDLRFDDGGVTHLAFTDGVLKRLDARVGSTLAASLDPRVGSAVAFSSRADVLATAGAAETSLWNLRGRELLRPVDTGPGVTRLAFDPRGDRLAAVTSDGALILAGGRGGEILKRIAAHPKAARAVCWSADGRRVATAGADGDVVIWLANQCSETARLACGEAVYAVAWSPRDTEVIAVASEHELSLWHARDRIRLATLAGHDGAVRSIAFSHDGMRLISGGDDATVRVWDVDSGRPLLERRVHDAPIRAVCVTPDDGQVFSLGDDDTLRVTDLVDGREIARLIDVADGADVAIDATGTTLAIAAGDGIRLVDARSAIASVRLASPSSRPLFALLLERKRFDDFDNVVQGGIALGVGLSGDAELLPIVVELLGRSKKLPSLVRAHLTLSLGRLGNQEVKPVLLGYLRDKDTQVRRSAALATGLLFAASADPQVLRELERAEEKEREVLTKALLGLALARVGGTLATRTLYGKLVEPRVNPPNVVGPPRISLGGLGREPFAALGLGIIGHANVSPTLLARFDDTGAQSVRGAIALALGLVGDQRTAPNLHQELQKTADPLFAGQLAVALGLLRYAPAIPDIERLIAHGNDIELLPDAARSLALLDRARVTGALLNRLRQDSNPQVQRALFYALGQVGDESAAAHATGVLRDAQIPALVRTYAAIALGDLLDPRRMPKLARLRGDANYAAETELLRLGGWLTFL